MSGKETRYSVGLFSGRKGLIEVPKELIDDQHPLKYKPFDIYGILSYFVTQDFGKECTVKAYCGI